MRVGTKKMKDGSERVMLGAVIWKEKPVRKRAPRKEWRFSVEMLRLREIEAIIRHRHGRFIPDPAGTDERDTCVAYLEAAAGACAGQDLAGWARRWAPWADDTTVVAIATRASTRKRMMKSDGVAGLLGVTLSLRDELELRTIGACDVTKIERKKLAKERKRERGRVRMARKRSQDVRCDRQSYEANSAERTRPWEAEGVSRRTWYRRRGTSVSRIDIYRKSDIPVPSDDELPATPPPSSLKGSLRAAHGAGGSGSETPAGLQGAGPHGSVEDRSEEAA
jgi:hypothetical protein